MITSTYELVALLGPPAAYNYWATLCLDIFNVVMWLSAFALLMSQVAPLFQGTCYYGYCSYLSGIAHTWAATQMGAAGLGVVQLSVSLPRSCRQTLLLPANTRFSLPAFCT